MAFIIVAIIGIVFLALFAVAGFGSVESSAGHFLKDTLHGTPVEKPAAAIESAGTDLTAKAHGAIAVFSGLLLVIGLVYVRSKP
ncbi:MAG: hypothetical protein WCJ49_05230 [Deltaproteobacteria bacterium]